MEPGVYDLKFRDHAFGASVEGPSAQFVAPVNKGVGAGATEKKAKKRLLATVHVVPKVTAIFEDFEQALPWYTQMLIVASDIFAG